MRCRALDGGWGLVAVAAVAAGVMAAGSTSATVEVRGSLEGAPEGATVEVALVRAPTLYELFAAVLNDDSGGLYTVEATVQAVDGRYALEVADPGVRWVRVRGFGTASLARLLVGPETDTLLPPLEFQRRAFCTLTLEGPTSAWIVRGESPGDLGYSRSWTTWPPLRRLEAGRKTRYEFEAGRTAPIRPALVASSCPSRSALPAMNRRWLSASPAPTLRWSCDDRLSRSSRVY